MNPWIRRLPAKPSRPISWEQAFVDVTIGRVAAEAIRALVNGVRYHGRSAGSGMVFFGKH